ncbi:uracil-DNA glycosylase family protein [Lutibacter sp.]|uniref:uracil-DNA glycosylase family protein n=1 Tax=Lutibacter sp. TaxID=1925666 RepID=UPI002735D527|nr:uracil-DNA glycosylase family protein [Lutibacter sp.]MDP3312303.1 uracil-DNA glycosylase family protein [Lutibacter sp.]
MNQLLEQIKNCKECELHLQCGANPIVQASSKSKIVIIGQAPARITHNTGVSWNDISGNNLRTWLGIDKQTFYDAEKVALMPMGFCYPGTGKNGDFPPRKECAPLWHNKLLVQMPELKLIVLVGQFAQKYYLSSVVKPTLTETVQNFETYLPRYFPLPHPSPRNNIWQAKNPWFSTKVLPELQKQILQTIN